MVEKIAIACRLQLFVSLCGGIMKPNGSPSYALGNPCGILLASVVLGHPIQQLPEDIHGIAAVRGPVQQLRREATYKSL